MKTTLLLSAGLLCLIGAVPASATPILNAAQLVSQASINPIYMHYEGIKGSCQALDEAARLIEQAIAEAPRAADPPDPDDTERIGKVGQGDVILAGLLRQAADANTTEDAAGLKIIDEEGFAKTFARMLNNKNPELTRFAAIGWGLTEKRAASKIASIAKNPTMENTHPAIIAILIGLLRETEGNTYYVGTANGGIWKSQQEAVDASDLAVWRSRFGAGI